MILRYRTPPGLPLEQATLSGAPGLRAQLHTQPGGRKLAVQLTGDGLSASQSVTPVLSIPGLPPQPLAAVTGAPGGRLPPAGTRHTRPQATHHGAVRSRRTVTVHAGLADRSGPGRRADPGLARPPAGTRPARPHAPPGRPHARRGPRVPRRPHHLPGRRGRRGQQHPHPLGGPFDLGQMARVPHLSGLRAEQHRDGLRILRIPTDLEVSQGARLLQPGDVVRPGTLLGVAVARRARAPHPTLGSLAGLGLPLALHSRGPVLHVRGPYGEHALRVHAPTTDLGVTLRAPALEGLSVSLSGRDLLLLHAPDTLQLRVAGENTVLTPGTPLPPHAVVDFLS
ncbi:hypothetical protein [Deinococcus aquaticus]|uniref:hypothetical protein n=1 Tax=Deinococcus aquaticus TaxID=328692 RepID=UPI0036072BF2